MFGFPGIVSIRLDELEIFSGAGASYFYKHASTLPAVRLSSNNDYYLTNVSLHLFLKKRPSNPHGYVGKPSKNHVLGGKLSNPGPPKSHSSSGVVSATMIVSMQRIWHKNHIDLFRELYASNALSQQDNLGFREISRVTKLPLTSFGSLNLYGQRSQLII